MMFEKLRDPVSGLTHLFGAFLALPGTAYLLLADGHPASFLHTVSLAVFGLSLLLLYGASSAYHLVQSSPKITLMLRRLDHMMIYILIAGTYTPICLLALPNRLGSALLSTIWILAAFGMLLTLFFINTPRWLTVAVYIGMGWMALLAIKPLLQVLPPGGIFWMVLGGLMYSGGAVIYTLKKPDWFPGRFGFHEVWHLFVMAGSLSHFWMIAAYVRYL
jgi:hemolysin III